VIACDELREYIAVDHRSSKPTASSLWETYYLVSYRLKLGLVITIGETSREQRTAGVDVR
jgi:hypothetical protein